MTLICLWRWYSEIRAVPSAIIQNRSSMVRVIDKAFVLNVALKRFLLWKFVFWFHLIELFLYFRELKPFMWREIVVQASIDDFPLLCSNDCFLSYAIGSCRKLKYDVFYHAKTYFLNMLIAKSFCNATVSSIASSFEWINFAFFML